MLKKKTKFVNVHCFCHICKIEWTPDPDERPLCPEHGTWNMVETKVEEVEVGGVEQLGLDI